ncbi:TonB-dependent receptor plug domain-containing protein [Thiomonas sp. FB-Cd]|uniref:TonB-dependent receptor plug domain-containing protein n=1 Tax=Thiomonas sp. FB-Cd TaxID=1158292 RepID=UPI00068934F3|nr:Plug domain-containing protein [Thiomonas sp. FB-Cd]
MTGRVGLLHSRSLNYAKSFIAAGLFQAGVVHAQQVVHGEAAQRPVAAASAVQSLAPVTVQGVAYGAGAVALPSTITVLGRRALTQGQAQVNLSESLGQVPGLIVNNRQDYAQDMQVSIRGFGADAPFGVQGVYMTLDGIPLTMPDGQGQSQIMNLATLGA